MKTAEQILEDIEEQVAQAKAELFLTLESSDLAMRSRDGVRVYDKLQTAKDLLIALMTPPPSWEQVQPLQDNIRNTALTLIQEVFGLGPADVGGT